MSNISNHSTNPIFSSEMNEIDLRGVFYDLLDNKWTILAIMFLITVIGFIYASTKVPQYQADVLLQVENEHRGSLGMLSNLSQLNLNSGAESPASIQSALIRSRFILEPVIQLLGLDITTAPYQMPIIGRFFSHKNDKIHIEKLDVPFNYINQPLQLIIDKPAHYYLRDSAGKLLVQGKPGECVEDTDHLVTILVDKMEVPNGTKFVVIKHSSTAMVDRLIPLIKITDIGSTLGDASRTGILRLSLTGNNPYELVSILNTIAKVVQDKDTKRKSLEAAKTLNFLTQQLPLVKTSLEQAEERLNQYRAQSGKIDIKTQTQLLFGQLANLDKELAAAQLYKLQMMKQYTSEHPFVINLNERIKRLKEEQYNLQIQLKKLPASDQIAINFMRDVKVKNELYLILLNKIQELKVIEAGTVSDVRILSLATLPDAPLPSGRRIIILASVILGFMLGCIIVLGRKALIHKVEDPNWIERHLNIINVVIIPYSKRQATNFLTAKNSLSKQLPLLAHDHPRDITMEALRSLRTSLQVTLCGATNNIVAIIGVSPAIGKSFISANFAYLLAEAGKRVLLIDGDIRRGHLQDYFQLSRMPGLTELLDNKVAMSEVLKVPYKDKGNLTFLPAGKYPSNPSEVLMNPRFKELVNNLSQQFDIVLIDTAPVLAVTDGTIIGAIAGTNLLVVGSKMHQPEEIEITIKRITSAGVKLHGSIYNNIKPETKLYGSYRYNYYYDYDSKE